MNDGKQDAPKDRREGIESGGEADPRSTKPQPSTRKPGDETPGELVEGEGSPGLTITGGGGHA